MSSSEKPEDKWNRRDVIAAAAGALGVGAGRFTSPTWQEVIWLEDQIKSLRGHVTNLEAQRDALLEPHLNAEALRRQLISQIEDMNKRIGELQRRLDREKGNIITPPKEREI